jgi:hypothetical protein
MRLKHALLAIAAVASLSSIGAGQATELITNGNFETGTYGQIGYNATLQGWNTSGYNFLFNPSNDEVVGVNGSAGTVRLWGLNNGGIGNLGASPVGGNYVAADGAYQVGALSQLVTGLTAGQKYNLSFYWAGAQQYKFDGVTTEQFKVTFGNDTYYTAVKTDPSHGFTGWTQDGATFTATGTSELLSFLAIGTPGGEPPFSLLDGVSMSAIPAAPASPSSSKVPEPSTLAILALGLGILGVGALRRKPQR